MSRARAARIAAVVFATLCVAPAALAHPLAPSLLELREGASGDWSVLWKSPRVSTLADDPRPLLPASCVDRAERRVVRDAESLRVTWAIHCDAAPATMQIGIEGLFGDGAGLLRIARADGSSRSWLLGRDRPSVDVALSSRSNSAADSAALAVRNVASLPTLAVLVALFLVLGRGSAVLYASTFAVGQSLALATLSGVAVSLPAFWLPIATAMALLLIGARLIDDGDSWKRGRWLAALALGLSQGALFAVALGESPFDAQQPIVGLVFGVAALLGEVAVVGALAALAAAWRAVDHRWQRKLRTLPAYAVGAWAVFFILERLASLP